MDNINNVHVIEAKYLPATNARGSRVKLYSRRFGGGVTIPFDYSKNSIEEMAIDYLVSKGFEIVSKGEARKFAVIISNTFKPLQ